MIYELPNFFTYDECIKYIEVIDSNKKIIPFTNSGKFINNKWDDINLATTFYDKIRNYHIRDNILRPNKVIMSGKYAVGDSFSLHTDTGLFYDTTMKEESRWTLLIYLNDDYIGGETVFYDDCWNIKRVIKPQVGKGILFDIDLWHQGNSITSGEKYWIGCEIIGKIHHKAK